MLRLGHTIHKNTPIELTMPERRQGTYIIGTTGTGKSTLLKEHCFSGYGSGPYSWSMRS